MRNDRYVTLDGVRGIAAMIVVSVHERQMFPEWHVTHGFLAVDLFFIMSGFVLARTYEARLLEGRLSVAQFMRSRVIRLYPLYILGTVLGVVGLLLAGEFGSSGFMTNPGSIVLALLPAVFMLPAAMPSQGLYPLDRPCWSLFFELIANVLYAKYIRFLHRRVLIATIAAAWFPLVALIYFKGIDYGYTWKTVPVGFVRVIFAFATGVLIHRLARKPRAVSNVAVLLVLIVSALVLAIGDLANIDKIYVALCVSLLLPMIVVMSVRFEPEGWLRKLCMFSGATSYGIYVLHVPLGVLVVTVETGILRVAPGIVSANGVPFVVTLALLALMLERSYDGNFRRLLDSLLSVGSARNQEQGTRVP